LSRPLTRAPRWRAAPRSQWTEQGGGWDQFDGAFPGTTMTLTLSAAGPTPIPPTPITLTANYTMLGTPVDMNAGNPHLKYYNETLYFAGTLPLWNEKWTKISNVSQNAGRDQYVTLTPASANGMLSATPLTVKAYSCAEFSQRVPCGLLSAPPPPANWTSSVPMGIYGRRRLAGQPSQQQQQQQQQQQGGGGKSPQAAPSGGSASGPASSPGGGFVVPSTMLPPGQERQLMIDELNYIMHGIFPPPGYGFKPSSSSDSSSNGNNNNNNNADSPPANPWTKWGEPGDWNNSHTWALTSSWEHEAEVEARNAPPGTVVTHYPPFPPGGAAARASANGGWTQAQAGQPPATSSDWKLPQATSGVHPRSAGMGMGGGAPGAAPGMSEEGDAETWSEWEPLPGSGTPAAQAAAASAPDQCVGYFRQVSFLSSLTLTASLSGVNASWTLAQDPCGADYVTATVPVSVHVFDQDMYPGDDPEGFVPMAWCADWPLHVDGPTQEPTVVVRGAGDPYLVAGAATECTWDFARPVASDQQGERLALAATGVVAAGLAACALCACAAINMRTRVDYGPLLRDGSERRAGYGAVDTAVGKGGDIEVQTFSRPVAAAAAAQAQADGGAV
jgi:hypothetical protein